MANHSKDSNWNWEINLLSSGEILNTASKYMDANMKINKFTQKFYSIKLLAYSILRMSKEEII